MGPVAFVRSHREAVQFGSKALDRVDRDWPWNVDPDRLNIAYPRRCIIGQLYGRFDSRGLTEFHDQLHAATGVILKGRWANRLGFSTWSYWGFPLLNYFWSKEIRRRRESDAAADPRLKLAAA